LPYPTDLGQGYGFSKDGLWVPRTDLEEIEIERLVQHVMQTMTARPDLNSHQRRVLSKRKYFVEWTRSNPSKSMWLLEDHWPLPFGRSFVESGEFRRYILDEITSEDANIELRFYITDPVAIYETWFEAYGRDNPVPERRDKIADKLVIMLKEQKEKSDDSAALKKQIKQAINDKGENALSTEQRDTLMALSRELATFRAEINSPEEISKHPTWVNMFGDEEAQVAAQVVYGLYSQKRDIKLSDAID
jgi:hypothetical protein